MEASRAATGMLEVLAIRMVRSSRAWPVRGSCEVGQFGQDAGHFIAPLAAAHVDDEVGLAPLGELVLGDGLAGAEPPGDGRGAALGQGKQVSRTRCPVIRGSVGQQALPVRPALAHRPAVPEEEFRLPAPGILHPGDGVI